MSNLNSCGNTENDICWINLLVKSWEIVATKILVGSSTYQ